MGVLTVAEDIWNHVTNIVCDLHICFMVEPFEILRKGFENRI